jgi:hypothetical protein
MVLRQSCAPWRRAFFWVLLWAFAAKAIAHGEEPQHGGVIVSSKEISYELVIEMKGLAIHVADHGNPMPTHGIKGKVVLVKGSLRLEGELKPDGGNRLFASGLRWEPGQTATAVLTMPSGRAVVVQFPARP